MALGFEQYICPILNGRHWPHQPDKSNWFQYLETTKTVRWIARIVPQVPVGSRFASPKEIVDSNKSLVGGFNPFEKC